MENRKLQYLLIFIAAGWIALSTAFIDHRESQVVTAAKEGFAAPGFELMDYEGKSVKLSDFKGQVVLLNLWASWCTPCRAEMPAMEEVYQNLKDQGFVVLAVNMTAQDDQQQAHAFAVETGLTFPVLFDPSGDVQRAYALQALPTSFFIDREGIIQLIVVGGPMPESLIYSKAVELLEVD